MLQRLRRVLNFQARATMKTSCTKSEIDKDSNILNLKMIGANLSDPMFQGVYRRETVHEADLNLVLERAFQANVEKIILTSTQLEDLEPNLELIKSYDNLFTTVGVHPTRCLNFERNPEGPRDYFDKLAKAIEENPGKIVAIGECGLDYARTEFCPIDKQIEYFEYQFELADKFKLPMFLHNRDTGTEFTDIIRKNRNLFTTGVVHSFDGPLEEAKELIEMGLFIGINGCSMKTEENLLVIKELPIEKMLIETDAPWCGIKTTHASYKILLNSLVGSFGKTVDPLQDYTVDVKGRYKPGQLVRHRNEPCLLVQILRVVAELHRREVSEVADIIYNNTLKLFNLAE